MYMWGGYMLEGLFYFHLRRIRKLLCAQLLSDMNRQYTRCHYDVTHVFEGVMRKCDVENLT